MSQSRVRAQVQTWKTHLPKVTPYYAVKSNPEPYLLEEIIRAGFGFDCASAREIDVVRAFQTNSPIVYANPCKKTSDILYASSHGIQTTVIDSIEEVEKLHASKWRGDSLLRIRVDDSKSMIPFSKKFGVNFTDVSYIAKYAFLRGQHISGVSFHVGSGSGDSEQFSKAIITASDVLYTLREYGHSAKIIDIGGGFTKETFIQDAKQIRLRMPHLSKDIVFIAEPGRFLSETSHDLFVKVIGKKPAESGNGFRYTIDESLYGQFSCIPFDGAKPKWLRIRESNEEQRPFLPGILYGRTCDSVDMIASSSEMEELMEGDLLWFPYMGAYTSVTSSEFNGFPRPYVYKLEEEKKQLPHPSDFLPNVWPRNVTYVSSVKVL